MPHHPRLGILFSGGLDCMSLAAIANSYIPEGEPIDLFNVAFENPRALKGIAVTLKNSQQQKKKKTKLDKKLKYLAKQAGNIPINPNSITEVTEEYQFNIYDVPDRVTARQGLQELKTRFPQRPWQLVEIDVPYTEAVESKKKVLELASPSASVMDLSIAIAFWFAAKGVGRKISITGDVTEMYTSPVKVLFSGLGADEQLGGYRRHRGSYESNGWQGLVDELQLDVDRIATRNLGRDDRVISDHAKEVRFPFLDEKVIDFLSSLPCFVKSNPTVKEGLGDKILLRSLALDDRLGPLTLTAKEPKRAIQFGARTAKMHDKKEKGDDLADNSD
ncbi:Asparagine synthetase domain-containing protein 1 [Clydaea vesicula]|uniref:Asparagine synthetase domain-containing protein 1 n=1 Tax=Clydaea vesicula TaxID=447962 RepID=A0AAD5TVT9_9FUNG|nr:Asparagine synthetase domain-containing protein 1 [Clydaea vesicula]